MIKLGDTIDVTYGHNISKMWLVKDLGLKRMSETMPEFKGRFYTVLGFEAGKGWWTLNNGTLAEMRAYIRRYAEC